MIILIVFFSFLFWNIFNETLFLKYNGIKSHIFQRDWHLYDALFRIVLFISITINEYRISLLTIQLVILQFLTYHILFDIGFNIKRLIDTKQKLSFNNLFHIGGGSTDKIIKSIIDFLLSFLPLKLWDKANQNIRIIEAYFSLFIKAVELILILWILLSL